MAELFRNLIQRIAPQNAESANQKTQKSTFNEGRLIFMSGGGPESEPQGEQPKPQEEVGKSPEAIDGMDPAAEAIAKRAEQSEEKAEEQVRKKEIKDKVKKAEYLNDVTKIIESPDFNLTHLNQPDIKKLIGIIESGARREELKAENAIKTMLKSKGSPIAKIILIRELQKHLRLIEADDIFQNSPEDALQLMAKVQTAEFKKLTKNLSDENRKKAETYLEKAKEKPKEASEDEKAKLEAREKQLRQASDKAKTLNPDKLREGTKVPEEVVDLIREGEGTKDHKHFEKLFVLFKNQKQYEKPFRALGITERHHIKGIMAIMMAEKNSSFQPTNDQFQIYPSELLEAINTYAKTHPKLQIKVKGWDRGDIEDLQERLGELKKKLTENRDQVTDEELAEWKEKTKIYDSLTGICRILGKEDIIRKKYSKNGQEAEKVGFVGAYGKYETMIKTLDSYNGEIHQENGQEVYLSIDALEQRKFENAKGTLKDKEVSITVSAKAMADFNKIYDGNSQSVQQVMSRVFMEQQHSLTELNLEGALAKTNRGLVLTKLPKSLDPGEKAERKAEVRKEIGKTERVQRTLKDQEVKELDAKAVAKILEGPVGKAIQTLLEKYDVDADDLQRSLAEDAREASEATGTVLDKVGGDPKTIVNYLISEFHKQKIITFDKAGNPVLNKEKATKFINRLIADGVMAKRFEDARQEEQANPIDLNSFGGYSLDFRQSATGDKLEKEADVLLKDEKWDETKANENLAKWKEAPGWEQVEALLKQEPFKSTEKADEVLYKVMIEEFDRGDDIGERIFQAFFKKIINVRYQNPLSDDLENGKINSMEDLLTEYQYLDDKLIDLKRKDMRGEATEEEKKELKEIEKKHTVLKQGYLKPTEGLIRAVQKIGVEQLTLDEEIEAKQVANPGELNAASGEALVYGIAHLRDRNAGETAADYQEQNPKEFEIREVPEELLSENEKIAELQKQLYKIGVPIETVAQVETIFNAQVGAAFQGTEFQGAALRIGIHENIGVILTFEPDAVGGGISLHGTVYENDTARVDLGGAVTLATDLDPKFFFGANTAISMEGLEGQTWDNVDFNAFAGVAGSIFNPAGWMVGFGVGLSYNAERAQTNEAIKQFEDYGEVEKATTIETKVALLRENPDFNRRLNEVGITENQLDDAGVAAVYENLRQYLVYSSYRNSQAPFISGVGVGVSVGADGVYLGLGVTLNLFNRTLRLPYYEEGYQQAESVADSKIAGSFREQQALQEKLNGSSVKTYESGSYYMNTNGEIVALEGKMETISEPTTNLDEIVKEMNKSNIDARIDKIKIKGWDSKETELKVLSVKPKNPDDSTTNIYFEGYQPIVDKETGRLLIPLPAEGAINVSAGTVRTFNPHTSGGAAMSRSVYISSSPQDKASMLQAMRNKSSAQYNVIDGKLVEPILVSGADENDRMELTPLQIQERNAEGQYVDKTNPNAEAILANYEGFETTTYGIPTEEYNSIVEGGKVAPGLSAEKFSGQEINKDKVNRNVKNFWKGFKTSFQNGSVAPGEDAPSKEVILGRFQKWYKDAKVDYNYNEQEEALIVRSVQDLYYIENKGSAERQLKKFDRWSSAVSPAFEKGFGQAIDRGAVTAPEGKTKEAYANELVKHFMSKLRTGLVTQLKNGKEADLPEDINTWITRIATTNNRKDRIPTLVSSVGGFNVDEETTFGFRSWEKLGSGEGMDGDLRKAILAMSHKEAQTEGTPEQLANSLYDNQTFDQLVKSREILGFALYEMGIENSGEVLKRVLEYQSKSPAERQKLMKDGNYEYALRAVGGLSNRISNGILKDKPKEKTIKLKDGKKITGKFVEIKFGRVTYYALAETGIATYNKCTNPLIMNKMKLYATMEGGPAAAFGAGEFVEDASESNGYRNETAELGVGVAVGPGKKGTKKEAPKAKPRSRPSGDGKPRTRPGNNSPRAFR